MFLKKIKNKEVFPDRSGNLRCLKKKLKQLSRIFITLLVLQENLKGGNNFLLIRLQGFMFSVFMALLKYIQAQYFYVLI